MERMIINFLEDNATVGSLNNESKSYDKDIVLDFLIKQLYSISTYRVTSIKRRKVTKDEIIYYMKQKDETIEIKFPKNCFDKNLKYASAIQKEYEKDVKAVKDVMEYRLKKGSLGALIFAVAVATGTLAAYGLEKQTKNVLEVVEEFSDDNIYGTINDLKQYNAINTLENELRSHTGYGEVDGYKQSIVDHENSYCYLGNGTTKEDIYEKISKYCEKYELGEDVYLSACQKYELLLQKNTLEARKIDLLSEYEVSKSAKVKTMN